MIAHAYDNAMSRAASTAGFATLQDDAATAPPTRSRFTIWDPAGSSMCRRTTTL
ncbi:hypothetical protein [Streptomyces sp. LN549]|uniref:hypothetical protein n=1 Tax=Streptomyces sp. LN549 TaxID=3112979 RepID=UPI0037164065